MSTAAMTTRFHDLNLTVFPQIPKQIPRCLFGQANSSDTENLLKEALDVEKARFQARWGMDVEKENLPPRREVLGENVDLKLRPARNHVVRQANMHEFWKPRKLGELNNKQLIDAFESSMYNQSNNNNEKNA